MKNPIAILIFTQEVSRDASRKTLTPTKNIGVNRLIFSQLNNFVGQTAASTASNSTKLSVFYSNQLIEDSNNVFGKQLSAAIQKVFEKGFEKVICVGNDCPALSKIHILEAAEKLKLTDTVIGPDLRGGVYLLGVSKSTFNAEAFENIAWQSKTMLASYLKYFANQSISFTETLADIHTFDELQAYTSSRYLIRFLLQLIEKSLSKKTYSYSYLFDSQLVRCSSLRAPPFI